MIQPILSFAIPIYNFGEFIGATIKSIVDGAQSMTQDEYEIVIVDGNSVDDTYVVIQDLVENYKNIRYLKMSERGGIDRDLNTAIDASRGKYVWLFSGDDLLAPGWDSDIDVILVPCILCNFDMSPRRPNPIFVGRAQASNEVFSIRIGDGSLGSYLSNANSLDSLFGFMSSVIVRSSHWQCLPERVDYYGSCWAHCSRLIQGFTNGCTITYVPRFLINKRGGNDSFMAEGFVNRIGISIDGWSRIIEEFFQEGEARKYSYNLLREDISISLFLYGKLTAKSSTEVNRLHRMAHLIYIKKYPNVKSRLFYSLFVILPRWKALASLVSKLLPLLIRVRCKFRHGIMRI